MGCMIWEFPLFGMSRMADEGVRRRLAGAVQRPVPGLVDEASGGRSVASVEASGGDAEECRDDVAKNTLNVVQLLR